MYFYSEGLRLLVVHDYGSFEVFLFRMVRQEETSHAPQSSLSPSPSPPKSPSINTFSSCAVPPGRLTSRGVASSASTGALTSQSSLRAHIGPKGTSQPRVTPTRYSQALFQPCVKALAKAIHTSIAISVEGVLSVKHRIRTDAEARQVSAASL